jgi:hypothetical protein
VRAELDTVLHRVASACRHHPVLDQIHGLVLGRAGMVEAWLSDGKTRQA